MSALALPALPAATRMTPMLWRCLLLAVLLHVWLLLLLGSAPGGTARQGEGVWGAINVTLRGPSTSGTTATVVPPAPKQQSGPPGVAKAPMPPRAGGVVRETLPQAQAEAGAAQLGEWARRSTPDPAPPLDAPLAEPLSPMPPLPSLVSPVPSVSRVVPLLPAPAGPDSTIPLPPGRVVEERAAPVVVPLTPSPMPAFGPPQPALPPTPIAPPLSLPAPAPGVEGAPASAERSLNSPLARPPAPQAKALDTTPLAPATPLAAPAPAPATSPPPVLATLP
ncbi:MAG TPA: hypothetical protein VK439_09770, partial [Rubrivivax sp.]|nr:hypothetical protein [Rubrivivax sp.]